MRKGVTPWIAAGFLAIAGCGAAVDSADTVAEWAVADAVWIGAVEGDGPDVFGSISALAVDADGRILVFDDQAHELRTFAPDGSFLSRFGRRGGGPGEFKHVIGLSPAPDGSLWIVDGQNARYT
ncbi:MAG TPA: 6-bladed beta-propeller, partial [Longimicrobiales bacterium]|nr:6-bladed beta-propeller [Longimicrobiales bacterium]